MKFSKRVFFILCYLICFGAAAVQEAYAQAATAEESTVNSVNVTSPDGTITFALSVNESGRLTYAVSYRGVPVVEPSRLGLVVNRKIFGDDASLGDVEKYSANEKYATRGVHSVALNRYKGARVKVSSPQGPFLLDAKVFDDGVAFRYMMTFKNGATVEKDLTTFVLPAASTVWSQPDNQTYEGNYSQKKVESFKTGEILAPPATILLPGNAAYAAITEAGLTDFAGMAMVAEGNRGFSAKLAGVTKKTEKVISPWRVIMIGKDLNALVNNDIITSVSPSFSWKMFPGGYNTRWIKPGRSVWSQLAERGPVTLENMKVFTDMAAELGFEYNLVDEGWGHWKEGDKDHWALMKELVDYSAQKGVKIWVWKAYPDRRGIPGLKDEAQRKEFFKKCKELGIAGVKIELFDVNPEAQSTIRFYQAALKDAAANHLMVAFHGANKPTGETRTWPNEMARDAIRSIESKPPWAPANVTLPFTRMLAGHAAYAPLHFDDRLGEVTWAHHIASMAVFSSPFMCLGADPHSMNEHPARKMIRSIPTTWDETIVLPQSKIGELAVYARRKGDTWFLAAMNGVDEAKTIEVNLSFLNRGSFNFHAVKDEKDKQKSVEFESTKVSPWSKVTLSLNPYGGFIGRLEKIKVRPAPAPAAVPQSAPTPVLPATPPPIPENKPGN